MRQQLFIFILCVVVSISSFAQEGTTSPYSYYGIGALKFKGTIENRAMGGLSVYSDSIHLSILNPAGLSNLKLVNYSVGGSYKFEKLATSNASQNASTSSFDYIAIGIPLGKAGLSFGLMPYTAVGYKLNAEDDAGVSRYQGSGGLNRAYLAVGYNVFKEVRIGVNANYNFGNTENEITRFEDDVQFGSQSTITSNLRGFSATFGLSYTQKLKNKLQLKASAIYTPEANFTSDNSGQQATVLEGPSGEILLIDTREQPNTATTFRYPSQFTAGLGIGKERNWFLGAEYSVSQNSRLSQSTFQYNNAFYTDASTYRVGGFIVPKYNSFTSYWNRVVYRAGAFFEDNGITVNNQAIKTYGISFGVGLPVGNTFSNINIGFEIGKRGTKDFNLIQENFFNTFISLSLNDRWFQKRYYD